VDVELHVALGCNSNQSIQIPLFYGLPRFLTFDSPFKHLYFAQEFCDGGHNEGKVLDETLVELGHPIEDMYVFWHFWCKHIHHCQDFFQVIFLPWRQCTQEV
jgi:hypothetical protein